MVSKSFLLSVCGLLFIALGIGAFFEVPLILFKVIYHKLQLRKGTETFRYWKDIPIPVFNKFYFFNVTNAAEVMQSGAKPMLKEIGPFTYRLHLNKTAIKFNDNSTISYRETKTWFFEEKLSVGPETTNLTTINAPLAIMFSLVQRTPSPVREIVSLALDQTTEGFFIQRSVKELLFDGYPDTLTSLGPLIDPELKMFKGKFGYFWPKNATDDGEFTVYDGVNDIRKFNFITNYEGRPELKFWKDSPCNTLGDVTNGEVGPPLSKNVKQVKFFNSLLCRALTLNLEASYENDLGLFVRRFELNEDIYKNSTTHPPNACYTTRLIKKDEQSMSTVRKSSFFSSFTSIFQEAKVKKAMSFPTGVMDLSECQFGFPLLLSNPHFLNADPYFLSTIEGLKPEKDLHGFWMEVEPVTGVTSGLAARFQLNVHISKPQRSLYRYSNVPEIVFPVFWQEMSMELSGNIVTQLHLANKLPSLLPQILLYSFTFLGGLLITFSLITFVISNKENEEDSKSMSDEKLKVVYEPLQTVIITKTAFV